MIAVDTNVVVRLLTRDEEKQFQKALALFTKHTVFIPESVFLETEWVLRFAYQFSALAICDALEKLLGLPNVQTRDTALVSQAIAHTRTGLDFADALHLAASKHCEQMATFDVDFVKKSKGLSGCRVVRP